MTCSGFIEVAAQSSRNAHPTDICATYRQRPVSSSWRATEARNSGFIPISEPRMTRLHLFDARLFF
jgi:hypothetical protein